MNESEIPPDGQPVDVYLDLLRIRMDPDDYEVLLRMVEPVLQAIEEQRPGAVDLNLDDAQREEVSQEIRDEAALVIATAVTGRLDNELIEIDTGDAGPVRIVTDSDTASDPVRRTELTEYIRERHRQDEELRGIAEASDLPTDF
ncbi:hypothetical protein [Streptomyces minutiscleroticus]|uniref:Uncharacterized protein n=1 Tax=Streptomyces minutiscleroticus TaxID=68238 RepID=A0A918KQM0_9ACTN|nr:hypothetical protein [Streptomyces minutiscleroticus]GGX72969.1 hypothetical protein GCM10010358_29130 [Streptomyces minutiscleroticus]